MSMASLFMFFLFMDGLNTHYFDFLPKLIVSDPVNPSFHIINTMFKASNSNGW